MLVVTATAAEQTRVSTWEPLRSRIFRLLWVGQLASNIGTWMQTVGAQWMLTGGPHDTVLVALVQTASSLPIMLLALPAGALADLVDRRKLLLGTQFALVVTSGALAAMTLAGRTSGWQLLGFTFALGCFGALSMPGWQAIQPDLVPRRLLPQASALGGININLARAVGPALGGLLVAAAGPGWVFAVNALSYLGVGFVLIGWRPSTGAAATGSERFLPAMRIGARYVLNRRAVRRILGRVLAFAPGASALWALLPVLAVTRLHTGPGGYGVLLGAIGVGAVLGAFALGRLRASFTPNQLVLAAALVYAAATAAVAFSGSLVVAVVVLPLSGIGWIITLSNLNAAMQLALPAWVRARALAVYLLVFQGSMAIGAALWGVLAAAIGAVPALLCAAVVLVLGAVSALRWPLPDTERYDAAPSVPWPEPMLVHAPEPDDGPVLVTVSYHVLPDAERRFLRAVARLRGVRRATGAASWSLYRDPVDPDSYLELFVVDSWAEHLRQHDQRQTVDDGEVHRTVLDCLQRPPDVRHLLAA